ncbi:hypothetical protein [Sediminibacillus massiliensis]|uniref:hypothetical protein n=1 Tax=Sediminibacillus massiliensis TaxID=1926277 RepID=UPI0015C3F15C|nr:hypothetical protein [Sediminibacillus massiliensis]
MGRDEHNHSHGKNKRKLPLTPGNEKDRVGVDMEMAVNPEVQLGINEEGKREQNS